MGWRVSWDDAEALARAAVQRVLARHPEVTEPAAAVDLVGLLGDGGELVASSSMPVRDLEWYAPARVGVRFHANRGANGIDGVVSTAVGVASQGRPTALLVGDVAFLHDTNGLLGLAARPVNLVIVVVHNDGGGIFSFLSQHELLDHGRFEQLFGTPHGVDLVGLARAHGVPAEQVATRAGLQAAVAGALTRGGPRVVVARTDRDANVEVHRELAAEVAAAWARRSGRAEPPGSIRPIDGGRSGWGADVSEPVDPPRARRVGTVEVEGDRVVGWAEFGHPDGDPVLWFHGTPGACLQVPPTVDAVALGLGFRVIAVERPGTGRSTDHRYRRVIDIGADVEQLADRLELERFAVVGLSGGGPYTLAVARSLPDRVVVASLLGGLGPVRGPDAVASYTRALRFAAVPLEVLRTPVGDLVGSLVRLARPVADPVFEAYARFLGFADRPVLSDPTFKAMFLHDLITADELRSVAHDMALFARHWGFRLDEVEVPVVVWQGLADVIVPPSHGHHQAARLPRGELRVREGQGHFAGFAEVGDVLERIREVWGDRTAEPASMDRRGQGRA